ncbi:nuclear transport factor 2 family protein [Deinococcus sp. MIMF12]|uniref:Nuclear transport factor 2 family protein n=1 Tax=Deinococcus rhizophilus TaxID=3049544 RepID=A0ABT7JDN3_9DEIO|nr:nuclear transport factor 2 family protein [Deinococcus rhizophilus]MDL2343168.1 nuclear transport factor 2 family protein [Deinococcus rhizophilus]
MGSSDVDGLDAVLRLDDAWNAAYHRRDPDAMAAVLADDWVGFFPDGRAVFKAELLEGMRHNPPVTLMFERHAARVHGETGFTRGTLYANGSRVQSFFRVYARRGGEWRAVGVQVVP